MIRAAVRALDGVVERGSQLAHENVPSVLQRQVTRDIAERAQELHASGAEAARAVRRLGLSGATAGLEPLDQAVEGANLIGAKAREHIAFGAEVSEGARVSRRWLARTVSATVDEQLRTLLQRSPRELQPPELVRLRTLLEAREAASGATAAVAPSLRAGDLATDAAGLVDQLGLIHLQLADTPLAARTARVDALLRRGADAIDPVDARELRLLLGSADDVAPGVPRSLGAATLDDSLARVAAGSDTPHDRRIVALHAQASGTGPTDVRASAAALLDEQLETLTDDGYRELSAILRSTGADADALRATIGASEDSMRLVDEGARGARSATTRTELHRWRALLDGSGGDVPRLRSELASMLADPVETIDAGTWSRARAHAQLLQRAGDELAPGAGGTAADDVLASLASGNQELDHATRRIVAGWRMHVGGTGTDQAARDRALLDLLDPEAATLDPAGWARLHALVDADASSTAPRLVTELEGARPAHDALAASAAANAPEGDALRYLERWRADLDGTTADPARTRAVIEGLLERPLAELQPRDWARLSAVVESADPALGLGAPINGLDANAILHGHAASARAIDHETNWMVETWRAALDGSAAEPSARAGALHALVERDPAALGGTDWARLRALVDADSVDAGTGIAHELDGIAPAADVLASATGGTPPSAATQRYLAAWRVHLDGVADDPERLRTNIRSIVDSEPESLGPREWAHLRALADVDGASGAIGLRQQVDGVPAREVLDGIAAGTREVDTPLRMLLADWQQAVDGVAGDPVRLRARLGELLAQDPASMSATDRIRLAALLDIDARTGGAGLASSIDGLDDAATVASALAAGTSRPDTVTRYRDVWRLQLDGTAGNGDELRRAMLELAERDTTTFQAADWSRVRSLLEADAASGTVGFNRQLPDAVAAGQVLESLIDGSRTPGSHVRRYLSTWRAQADGSAGSERRLTRELQALIARDPEQMTPDDWIRLRTLVELDHAAGRTRLATGLMDPGASATLERLAESSTSNVAAAGRYLQEWAIALDGTGADSTRTSQALRRLLDRERTDLNRKDWHRMRALVDSPAGRVDLGLVHALDESPRSTDLFRRIADRGEAPGHHIDRYMAAWKLQIDGTARDPGRLRDIFAPLRVAEPQDLTPADWMNVRAALDVDASAGGLGLVRELDGAKPASKLLQPRALGESQGEVPRELLRYVRTWRAQLDGSAADGTKLADELRALLARDELGAEGRAGISALLDQDAGSGALGLGREIKGLPGAHQLLAETAPSRGALARYTTMWNHQLDGTASDAQRLRERLEPLVSSPADQMTREDWANLRALVDADRAGGGLGLVAKVDGDADAWSLLDAAASGGPNAKLERYRAAWQHQLDGTATDRASFERAMRPLLTGDPSALEPAAARRILSLIDADRATRVVALRRNIHDLEPASQLLGGTPLDGSRLAQLRRYVATWNLQLDGMLADPAAGRAALRELVEQDIEQLTPDQWARVTALVAADDGGRLGVSRTAPGLDPAEKLVARKITGTASSEPLHTYVDRWRLQLGGVLRDPDLFRTQLRGLLDKPPEARTTDDWRRLRSLVEADQQLRYVGLTHELPGVSFTKYFDHFLAGNKPEPSWADAYPRVWRMELDGTMSDPDRLRPALLDIVSRRPGEVTRSDWMLLHHALARDAVTNRLRLTQSLPGINVHSQVAAAASGTKDDGFAQRILGAWRLDLGGGFGVPESLAVRDGRLAPHLIRRSDVPAFLADSAWPHTAFHGNTNARTYEGIVEEGARVDKNKRSAFGKGFYNALEPGGWGDDVHEVAIRARRPFVTASASGLPSSNGGIRDTLLARGYDSIIVKRGRENWGDWIIALRDEDVKIVVEDAADVVDTRLPAPYRYDPDLLP